jgi:hypothetical protein
MRQLHVTRLGKHRTLVAPRTSPLQKKLIVTEWLDNEALFLQSRCGLCEAPEAAEVFMRWCNGRHDLRLM